MQVLPWCWRSTRQDGLIRPSLFMGYSPIQPWGKSERSSPDGSRPDRPKASSGKSR